MATTSERPNRNYEAVIVLHPDIPEEQQKDFFKWNQKTIQSFKGSVNHLDTWGKRRLANPLKNLKVGTFFHTTFEAQGECIEELERVMKIDERVLRYVHMKLDDEVSLKSHVEKFHSALAETHKREQEKEAKFQARKLAQQNRGEGGSRGPRDVNYAAKRSAPRPPRTGEGEGSSEG